MKQRRRRQTRGFGSKLAEVARSKRLGPFRLGRRLLTQQERGGFGFLNADLLGGPTDCNRPRELPSSETAAGVFRSPNIIAGRVCRSLDFRRGWEWSSDHDKKPRRRALKGREKTR